MRFVEQLFGFEREETRGSRAHFKLFELFLLQYAVRWAWEWGFFTRRVPAVVAPQGLARYLDISPMLGSPWGLVNAACLTVGAACVALGRWRRAWLPMLVLLLHLQYVARHCLGKVSHGSHFVGLGLLMLAVAAWCMPTAAACRRFTLGASIFFMGVGYSLAAFSKLGASGLSWVDGQHLWLWIGEKNVDHLADLGRSELNALQRLCLEHWWLATGFSSVGLLTELCGFLLWFARSRVVITLALIALHLGVYWALGILFDAFIYQLAIVGLPWSRVFDWAAERGVTLAARWQRERGRKFLQGR